MLDPLVVECVRAQTIECVNEVCMALAKYLRQTEKKGKLPTQPLSRSFFGVETQLSDSYSTNFMQCHLIHIFYINF